MNEIGILTMGAVLGAETLLIKPKRGIGSFVAQMTLREVHTDDLEITEHPVELGVSVADHAYRKPAEVVIECGWSNSFSTPNASLPASLLGSAVATLGGIGTLLGGGAPGQIMDIYKQLVDLQRSRTPFDVFTGKRIYKNMLIKTLVETTDKTTENMLMITATLREVIIVKTQIMTLSAPQASMMNPQTTLAMLEKGQKQLVAGLPHINIAAAANSLVNSRVADIAAQATGAQKSPPLLAQLFF